MEEQHPLLDEAGTHSINLNSFAVKYQIKLNVLVLSIFSDTLYFIPPPESCLHHDSDIKLVGWLDDHILRTGYTF